MLKNFWKGKRVLVTGFEGFLGSHLTQQLLRAKLSLIGIDIQTRRKETILSASDYKKMVVIKSSVCDFLSLKRIVKKYRIEVIFHLAARALVGNCFSYPREAFNDNIMGTWNVLEAARHAPYVSAVIIASSDKAYGDQKVLPYLESAPLCGRNPYDVSKSCADLLAYSYHHSFGLPVAITRCGNIFGPGDFNFSRIVPDAIRCALTRKTFLIRSDGKFTRDYVYVDDIVNGYILLAEKLKKSGLYGEAFNFSNESPFSVLQLVKRIYEIACKKPEFRILNLAQYEIRDQYLSAAKAKKILGWRPQCSLEEGLKSTIEWYRGLLNKDIR